MRSYHAERYRAGNLVFAVAGNATWDDVRRLAETHAGSWPAGRLDRTMGGPDIDQNLGLKLPRRSVYFRHAQEKQMEFLKLFDSAEVTECYQRKESVLPQQALALANSPVARQHARILARALAADVSDADAFTVAAFFHPIAYQFYFFCLAGLAVALVNVKRACVAPAP